MMTRERELLQQALDALDAITDDVDGTGLNTMPSFDKAIDAIAALREAMASPEPEPVAYLVEGWHDGKLIAHIPRLTLEDAKASAAVFSQHYTTTKLVPLYAAPPAAPAEDHATPSGGQEAGPQEDRIEAAYWRFDARRSGYARWKAAPMSERDAFKAEMRNALEAEKVRAEMRLVARGWRRPDTPAAPAPTAPVPDGWVMVPRGLLRRLIAEALTFDPSLQDKEAIEQAKQLAASPAAPAAPVVREPFSKAQLHRLYVNSPELHKDATSEAAFTRIVQLTEAAHGITGGRP